MLKSIYYVQKEFLIKVRKYLFGASKMPWMSSKERIIIEEILKNKKPKKCLEWGLGYSTLYFPQFLDQDAKWMALEYQKDWIESIQKEVKDSRISCFLVPPNDPNWHDGKGDGDLVSFKDYVEFPSQFGKFDFIFIDARARNECLIKAAELITDDGFVVLHDANREYYMTSSPLFKYSLLLRDYRGTAGGICIYSKTRPIQSVVNSDRHKKLWKQMALFEKLLHL